MDNAVKWIAIMVVVFLVVGFSAATVVGYQQRQIGIECARAGNEWVNNGLGGQECVKP